MGMSLRFIKHPLQTANLALGNLEVFRLCTLNATPRRLKSAPASKGILELLQSMPKDNKNLLKLRDIRKKTRDEAARKPQVPPSEVYLSVLGNGAKGTPRCLCVFTDHKRYLFNCGEGTQRLATEHRARLSKVHHIFFTTKSWQNIGGLPGISLTIQDIGVPEILLHGPPDIEQLYPMTKHFLMTKDMQINFRPYTDGLFEDNCFHITPVALTPSNNTEVSEESQSSTVSLSVLYPDAKRPRFDDNDVSVAYICKLVPKAGHLLLERCVDLGVPCGPLLGELKNGKDITLEDGRIVKASDVVAPPESSLSFIVVECPNENYLDCLLSKKDFEAFQSGEDAATVVAHFTPPSIVKHRKYQEWLSRFSPETSHLYLSSDELLPSFVSAHRLQYMLSFLDGDVFPALSTPTQFPDVTPETKHYIPTECASRFLLRPTVGFDRSSALQYTHNVYEQELRVIPNLDSSLAEFHKQMNIASEDSEKCPEYPTVIFFGTGSAVPNKVRNVSSILVELSETACILLDCGEGTCGQLLRFFGISEAQSVLCRLKTIFISHLHADHHMGLMEVLNRREEALINSGKEVEPINLIAPSFMQDYLAGYNKVFRPIMHLVKLVPSHVLEFKEKSMPEVEYSKLLDNVEATKLNTVFVHHCKKSYGITLTTKNGIKVVYSGDTMPCGRLIEAGLGCDILIHEATMADYLKEEASLKAHSTTSQAIEIGLKMGAKFTMLTHFSQRYSKIPYINSKFHQSVGVAFDNMKIRLSDLPKLPLMFPVLKCMFHEEFEEMNELASKKQSSNDFLKTVSLAGFNR